MGAERPCTIVYRAKRLPGRMRANYGSWCVWKDYTSCEVAQRAIDDLRIRYDFYAFRLQTNEGKQ